MWTQEILETLPCWREVELSYVCAVFYKHSPRFNCLQAVMTRRYMVFSSRKTSFSNLLAARVKVTGMSASDSLSELCRTTCCKRLTQILSLVMIWVAHQISWQLQQFWVMLSYKWRTVRYKEYRKIKQDQIQKLIFIML